MTAQFTVASDRPTPTQRVKLLAAPLRMSFVWLCCCGLNGRPQHTEADAYQDWEQHRAVCALRPAGEA